MAFNNCSTPSSAESETVTKKDLLDLLNKSITAYVAELLLDKGVANFNQHGVLTKVSNELSKVDLELLKKHVTLPLNAKDLRSEDIVREAVLSPCEVAININLELAKADWIKNDDMEKLKKLCQNFFLGKRCAQETAETYDSLCEDVMNRINGSINGVNDTELNADFDIDLLESIVAIEMDLQSKFQVFKNFEIAIQKSGLSEIDQIEITKQIKDEYFNFQLNFQRKRLFSIKEEIKKTLCAENKYNFKTVENFLKNIDQLISSLENSIHPTKRYENFYGRCFESILSKKIIENPTQSMKKASNILRQWIINDFQTYSDLERNTICKMVLKNMKLDPTPHLGLSPCVNDFLNSTKEICHKFFLPMLEDEKFQYIDSLTFHILVKYLCCAPNFDDVKNLIEDFYGCIALERDRENVEIVNYSRRFGLISDHFVEALEIIEKSNSLDEAKKETAKASPFILSSKNQLGYGIRPAEKKKLILDDANKLLRHDFACLESEMPVAMGMSGSANIVLPLFLHLHEKDENFDLEAAKTYLAAHLAFCGGPSFPETLSVLNFPVSNEELENAVLSDEYIKIKNKIESHPDKKYLLPPAKTVALSRKEFIRTSDINVIPYENYFCCSEHINETFDELIQISQMLKNQRVKEYENEANRLSKSSVVGKFNDIKVETAANTLLLIINEAVKLPERAAYLLITKNVEGMHSGHYMSLVLEQEDNPVLAENYLKLVLHLHNSQLLSWKQVIQLLLPTCKLEKKKSFSQVVAGSYWGSYVANFFTEVLQYICAENSEEKVKKYICDRLSLKQNPYDFSNTSLIVEANFYDLVKRADSLYPNDCAKINLINSNLIQKNHELYRSSKNIAEKKKFETKKDFLNEIKIDEEYVSIYKNEVLPEILKKSEDSQADRKELQKLHDESIDKYKNLTEQEIKLKNISREEQYKYSMEKQDEEIQDQMNKQKLNYEREKVHQLEKHRRTQEHIPYVSRQSAEDMNGLLTNKKKKNVVSECQPKQKESEVPCVQSNSQRTEPTATPEENHSSAVENYVYSDDSIISAMKNLPDPETYESPNKKRHRVRQKVKTTGEVHFS